LQGRAGRAFSQPDECPHHQVNNNTELFSDVLIFCHAEWENVSETGENCCLPQSFDQLLSDER